MLLYIILSEQMWINRMFIRDFLWADIKNIQLIHIYFDKIAWTFTQINFRSDQIKSKFSPDLLKLSFTSFTSFFNRFIKIIFYLLYVIFQPIWQCDRKAIPSIYKFLIFRTSAIQYTSCIYENSLGDDGSRTFTRRERIYRRTNKPVNRMNHFLQTARVFGK